MVLLINPPNPPNRVSNKDMMGGFGQCYPPECNVKVPPIDIPYTAAVLRESKIDVKVIDCLGLSFSLEYLIPELKKYPARLIFLRTSTSTFLWDTEVSRRIKEELNATVVFFGPHINVAPEDIMRHPCVDAIVFDEPEYTVRDIALRGFRDTPGVWYKEEGKIIKNMRRELIRDLDELPFPAWDMLPYMEYTIGNLMPDARPTLFMQTSRGCPYGCGYCPYPLAQGTRYRKRSPRNVLAEFEYLVKKFNVKNIIVRDAEYTLDRQRVVEICEGLIKAGFKIAWRCETRVDTLDEALIELMHKAGCIGINMGIESKSEEVCKKIGRKPLDEEHTRNIIRKCKELGVHTFCFFIIGLPGDDLSTVIETLKYAIALDADTSQFTVATPYLGTDLYRWASENNYMESFDLSKTTGYEAMMRNEQLTSEQIMSLRNEVQRIVDMIKSRGITWA
ncbi:MAG: radical SAM protein, partial [Deltaproteobacteria bacterium]|nr:radical SAM protein [Deltaproteobacteria bacterium]